MDSARVAELKCLISDRFQQEWEATEYMIEGCTNDDSRIKEYSLLIDLLENESFLNQCCKIKDINY